MESASNSAEGPEAQWRFGFRKRILSALEFLRGQNFFGRTQSRHFSAFNHTYSTNHRFRHEVGKLSPFEMEVFCISSTLSQLQNDSVYFTAGEVTQALAFKLQDQRRGEIRNRILSNGHDDLSRLYHSATERAIPDEDDRINDIQGWIQASLNNRAIQKLLDIMSHELPPTNMALSISLRMNGMEANLCQQPHLCDEALVLGSEFLDKVETLRDLTQAMKKPLRPRSSILGFLRFVFESSPPINQHALDRRLELRKMNSTSLVLCSATYTEKTVLSLSEERFRALLSICCEITASLPIDVVDFAATAKLVPEDHKAYDIFLRDLKEYQRARKAVPPPLPARSSTRAERPSGFGTSMTWPQEHVTAILRMPLNTSSSVLLGQLARLYKETDRDIPFPDSVIEALSTAAESSPLNDRMQILDIAAEMLTDSTPASARATIVHQRSVTLRLLGNAHQAEHEILSFLEKASDVPELLLESLKLSLAESRVYQFRHQEAHEITRSIKVGGDIGEFQLLWDHIYCVGRIMRGEGEFESAKVCFERCCAFTHGIRPSKVILAQCALADICCELDHLSRDPQHSHLLQAESVLEPAVKSLGETNSKSRRRLLLSLSEVYIRQFRVHEATTILKGLIILFDGLECSDIIDRLGHVRLHMTLARTCRSGQSMTYWREALRLNKCYNPDEEEVFTCAVIYLNLSWLSYCEGQSDQGQKKYAQAREVLQRKRPEFLMPGIGTYVYDEVRYKLKTKIPGEGHGL